MQQKLHVAIKYIETGEFPVNKRKVINRTNGRKKNIDIFQYTWITLRGVLTRNFFEA